ncbi:hypothetical protein [Paraburkholderia sp. MM6662-R1]|uniref:hypothetical protein n=1 Tax=Paraburkholderia sp. MM6662-R1 TaxID=2991066 RepID=UPI003D21CC55
MTKTLLLDRTAWDLVLDASGNIAIATEPYQIAQDVASAIRTFLGECWYDTTLGVPYWQNMLGQLPPASFVRAKLEEAARTVPNVGSATVVSLTIADRKISGEIDVTDASGNSQMVSF